MASIPLDELNALPREGFCAAIGEVVEHAPWVAAAVADRRPFAGVADAMAAIAAVIRGLDPARRLDLVRGHPDLAGKAARAGAMTGDSVAEQASAGLDRLSEAEFDRFHALNQAYRERFGFPFLICVRRHGKESILTEFERRLTRDPAAEQEAAVTEILRIVALRLDQRVGGPGPLKVHGRLSTHVLDTCRGRPAAGVAVALYELAGEEARLVAETRTNADGRTDRPLIGGRPVPMARYELRFAVGDYFRAAGEVAPEAAAEAAAGGPAFLDTVPVRFGVAEPEAHYHVPLLVTPWSYATYRGS